MGSAVQVRPLVAFTALSCAAALSLAQLAPVIGQTVWNAAQVGFFAVLLCLWVGGRDRTTLALTVGAVLTLPFALYVTSPGAVLQAVLIALACVAGWLRGRAVVSAAVSDAPARTPALTKFELLAFVATLLCSMYNFAANKGMPPYWASIFQAAGDAIGFTASQETIARTMYAADLPHLIEVGSPVSSVGAVVFALIWAVLPFMYVLYFSALAVMAKDSPGTRIQQALCALCVFHFLFLTDIVDYRFGRGFENPYAHWAHWVEVFAWRIAILLPIYQKVMTGQWLRGNGRIGVAMHYGLALWAVGFFVYEVVFYNILRFGQFVLGQEFTPIPKVLFGLPYSEKLGYHGALVLMTLVYAFMVLAMRCKRVVARPAPGGYRNPMANSRPGAPVAAGGGSPGV